MGIRRGTYLVLIFCTGNVSVHFSCDSYKIREPDGSLIYKFYYDTVALQYELLSKDTIGLLFCAAPLYALGRVADDSVHSCFYSAQLHKNCYSFDRTVCRVVEVTSLTIAAGLSSLALNWWDDELARSGRVFASGLLPLWATKNIFKRLRHDGCLRPRCEFFDQNKKYYGGCPSGHMAYMAYATAFWGLEYGWALGIPLGLMSATVFAISINSNRHFTSQLIAGTALGVAYGIAGHKVVHCYKAHDIVYDVAVAGDGTLGIALSCSF